ncbi:hypothetical protein V6N12_058615 [Hibiscus sabdariffa]|uniref:Uncharacterized protein n=1 Tax=Hibiscus sabdariffa TaxID=183260 RepID=A0ABR2ET61_9ROSI
MAMVTGVGHFLKTFYRRKYFADYGCEGVMWFNNIGLARNAKVFDAPQLEESSVIGSSSRLVSMMVQARAECQLDCPHVATISWGLTYWEPPPFAWIKLNTNEAWHESDGA